MQAYQRRAAWVGGVMLGIAAAGCQSPRPPAAPPVTSPTAINSPSAVPTSAPGGSPAAAGTVVRPPSPATSVAAPSPPAASPGSAPPSLQGRAGQVAAANAALAAGQSQQARTLYEAALTAPPSQGESAAAGAVLEDFSRIRLLVLAASNGDDSAGRAQLEALQGRQPASPFAPIATELWHEYGMTGDIRAACTRVAPALAPLASLVRQAGVDVAADSMCGAPPRAGGDGY